VLAARLERRFDAVAVEAVADLRPATGVEERAWRRGSAVGLWREAMDCIVTSCVCKCH